MNSASPMIGQELLASLDLKILAVQRTEAGQWWNYRQVISPFSRLWYIVKGEAFVTHNGCEHRLSPGRLHLVPAFALHDCHCPRQFDHYHLHFVSRLANGIDLLSLYDCPSGIQAGEQVEALFRRLESLYPNRKLPCYDPFKEEYRRHPRQMEEKEEETPAADWFEAQGILQVLLAPFLRDAKPHQGTHARVARQFQAVQRFIHERMERRITLADMAKAAGLNPTYFSDRFMAMTGIRPMEYLTHRRIERAQYLLLTTRCSIKEIASEIGLEDAAYFSRVFSRHCRVAPTEYRRIHGV